MGRVMQMRAGTSEDFVGHTGPDIDIINATFTLDTSIYASGDLLADPVELVGVFRNGGGRAIIDSIVLIDEDDQGAALNCVFTTASTTFGTLNSAPNISDANLRNVVGHVAFATTDYVDGGGTKIGTRSNINLLVEGASGATSLYVALVNATGTPTYTAAGVRIKVGFRRA